MEQKDAILIELPKIGKGQFSSRDWNIIESYVTLLKPVFEATKELSREDTPTLSMVLPIIYTIDAKLNLFLKNTITNYGVCFANNLIKSMSTRFDVYKHNQIYKIAMMIDPRFKGLMLNENEILLAKSYLKAEVEKYKENDETISQPSTSQSLPEELTKNYSLWDILHQRSISKESTTITSINEVTIEVRFLILFNNKIKKKL